jgi:hypothetical protein
MEQELTELRDSLRAGLDELEAEQRRIEIQMATTMGGLGVVEALLLHKDGAPGLNGESTEVVS